MNYLRILKVVFKIKKRLLFPIPVILILVFSIYHFVNETEGNTRYSTELNWGLDTINASLLWNKNINQSNPHGKYPDFLPHWHTYDHDSKKPATNQSHSFYSY